MKAKAPNRLTPDQEALFDSLVKVWQARLGLNDWRVERSRKPTKNMAEVAISHDARLAAYRVGDFGAAAITSDSIEATVVHELLHVLLCELKNAADYGIADDALASAEHRVINTLEKLLLGGNR